MEKRDATNSGHQPRSTRHEIHALTSEQIKHLIEAAQEQSLKALLTVAITTGLRRGELLGLRWQDLDVQDEILHVCRRVSCFGKIEATGTARTIALPKIALHALKEHQRCQEETRMKAGETWHDLGLVFPNEIGQYFDPSKLWQQSHALFVDAGFPHMRFHDLRRSTVALLLGMGVNVTVVQAILGFRQSRLTIKTLTPVSLSMQKDAMKKWDGLFSES